MKTDLSLWHILDVVVKTGGVSQAAEKLHKSQSAISYALKQLSEQTGVTLLRLVGRRLVLTSHGEVLLKEARLLLQQSMRFDEQVRLLSQGVESTLHIAIEQLVPMQPVLQALSAVQADFPHINVQWHEVVLSGLDEALSDPVIDVVIGAWLPKDQLGEYWLPLNLFAVAAASHPLSAQHEEIGWQQLAQYTQVVVRDTGSLQPRDVGWLSSPRRWTVDAMATMLDIVRSGLAYAWLPEHLIALDVSQGVVKPLALAEQGSHQVMVYITKQHQRPLGKAAQFFYEQLLLNRIQ